MLIYPGIAPLDVAGPLQVFGFSNFLMNRQLYDIKTVAPTVDAVPTQLGFSFLPACAMTSLPLPVDTLLVSGGGRPGTVTDPAIFDWLQRAGNVAESEMHRVFNCGIGMVIVVAADDADEAIATLAAQGERVFRVGTVVPRAPGAPATVVA